jgi:hypothetical protein
VAQYPVIADRSDLEALFDLVLGSLHIQKEVIDPDLALDFEHSVLQAELVVDADDVLAATEIVIRAMQVAFKTAGVDGPASARIYAHESLMPHVSQLRSLASDPVLV